MKRTSTLVAAMGIVAATQVFGADSADLALAKKSNCMACHTVDNRVVGPAFRDVAKKYAGDKSAETKLVAKVKQGGKGIWGEVPMPANSSVKDEDIKTLVKWVLAGAK